MKQLNLIAVPNGAFTLDQVLEDTLIKQAIKQLQDQNAPTTAKVKAFLAYYQMIDTLAQMHVQGLDISGVNETALKESMKYTIDVCYDSIMNSFSKQQRQKIRDLVQKTAQ